MRLLSALLLSTALVTQSVQAADISHQGAQQLEQKFTSYLPGELAKSGLIKVRPGTEDYEVTFDPTVLLKDIDPKTFSISGLKPFLSLIRPMEDGFWHFAQTADLDVKGQFTTGAEKTDFTYKIDAMRSEGIVDPDLLYFKSMDMTADGITVTSKSPQQSLEARFGSMTSTLNTKKATPETVDIRSNMAMNGFTETVIDPTKVQVDISADNVTADVAFNGLAYRPLQDIVFFLVDAVKRKTLLPTEQVRLKALVRANLPMFETLLESVEVANLKVGTPTGTFGAETLRYTINTNGLKDNASFGIGIAFDKPSVPPGTVPDAFKAALPDTVSTHISLENLNLASGITYFIDHADFNADKTLTDAQAAEAGRLFLPGGALTIKYNDVSARSSVYDFSLSGTTIVYPEQPGRQNTDLTLYAKDFDKTISYLQENAATVPQFGQAAFMLLMIKGFAKQTPDGRQMWNIAVDENKKVKINGQDLPF
ncbi:hypothetical protein ADU59_22600 [Pararhizobium polonicum]|uniref:DUF2125 domain-containing protein n=1 Tax=Pararhizobium polonicum TaxID=1612624 RepID=A0A1C7NW83_9HYPH|nr:hypothetical protein [Pararhizobium polonicum]OBZ93252.1 hypothetical protein ADU59_22600 [Pararhizobium polonicum]